MGGAVSIPRPSSLGMIGKPFQKRDTGQKLLVVNKQELAASRRTSWVDTTTDLQPVAACVPPGQCQFDEEWRAVPLLERRDVAHNARAFTFACPDENFPLGLSTCACILAGSWKANASGELVVRPYTPVSTNAWVGKFELLVKIYDTDPPGVMSTWFNSLVPGDLVHFKHIAPNVKRQHPFGVRNLVMLAGGTGVAPMIQALHAVLGSPADSTEVTLMYGSKTEDVILAREVLDCWQDQPGLGGATLKIVHILSREPEDSSWKGLRGRVDQDLIEQHAPPPTDDVLIFVCGPPQMYVDLCGGRGEKELTGVLADLGYSAEQVVKF